MALAGDEERGRPGDAARLAARPVLGDALGVRARSRGRPRSGRGRGRAARPARAGRRPSRRRAGRGSPRSGPARPPPPRPRRTPAPAGASPVTGKWRKTSRTRPSSRSSTRSSDRTASRQYGHWKSPYSTRSTVPVPRAWSRCSSTGASAHAVASLRRRRSSLEVDVALHGVHHRRRDLALVAQLRQARALDAAAGRGAGAATRRCRSRAAGRRRRTRRRAGCARCA